jgi:hypothetical protein
VFVRRWAVPVKASMGSARAQISPAKAISRLSDWSIEIGVRFNARRNVIVPCRTGWIPYGNCGRET